MQGHVVYIFRHGETEWSRNGRHTGRTDLPLTENGRQAARRLQPVLAAIAFELVLTSPLRRARETCALAGLGDRADVDPDLAEWDYGEYEGLTTEEVRRTVPGWMVFRDGSPAGEMPADIAARADRVIGRVREARGNAALFAHGHILRVLAARWLGLGPEHGAQFLLDTSTLSALGDYRGIPAIKRWNAEVGG